MSLRNCFPGALSYCLSVSTEIPVTDARAHPRRPTRPRARALTSPAPPHPPCARDDRPRVPGGCRCARRAAVCAGTLLWGHGHTHKGSFRVAAVQAAAVWPPQHDTGTHTTGPPVANAAGQRAPSSQYLRTRQGQMSAGNRRPCTSCRASRHRPSAYTNQAHSAVPVALNSGQSSLLPRWSSPGPPPFGPRLQGP